METPYSPEPKSLSPFLAIWFMPRGTIRKIVDTEPRKHIIWLAMAGGISYAISSASSRSLADTISLPVVLAICFILGLGQGF